MKGAPVRQPIPEEEAADSSAMNPIGTTERGHSSVYRDPLEPAKNYCAGSFVRAAGQRPDRVPHSHAVRIHDAPDASG